MNYPLKLLFAWITAVVLHVLETGPILLITGIFLVSSLYALGLLRLWRGAGMGRGIPVWRAACFLGGMLILVLALSTSVDEWADRAFSVHMFQHLLLMKVVAPLLILGEFLPVFLWAIGKTSARRSGEAWGRSKGLNRLWKHLSSPWAAWMLFASCLWIWHNPAFYQAALRNEPLHDLEHFLFLGTSLLFWWYLLQNGRDHTTRYGTSVLYLFTTLLQESALGALLTFSSRSWYPFYAASNPWGLSALADQQLAGVIMWLPGGILLMALIIVYFGAWLQAIEKRTEGTRPAFIRTGDGNE